MSAPPLTELDAPACPVVAAPEVGPLPGPVGCPECGHPLVERFCGRCGERRREPAALGVRHLAGELFEQLTSLDFKLVRTLVALVRRPGSLTWEFVTGRRTRYTRPLARHLLVSGTFFLISPHLPLRPIDPRVYIDNAKPHPTVAAHFHAIAAMLGVLLLGHRRLVAENLLFAVHTESFLLVLTGVTAGAMWPLGFVAGRIGRMVGVPKLDDVAAPLFAGSILLIALSVLFGHLHAALRRVHDLGQWGAAWRMAVLVLSIPFALYVGQFALVYLVALTGLH